MRSNIILSYMKRAFLFFTVVVLIIVSCYSFGNLIYYQETSNTTKEPCRPVFKADIYFVETSGKGYLDTRQMASLESVARYVQHDTITVFMFVEDGIKFNAAMTALKSHYAIRFEEAQLLPFFVKTPLEQWYNNPKAWKQGKYRTEHCSDAMRGALMWKRGGIFMDLDIIMIKPTVFDGNYVLWEPGNKSLASFLMVFQREHELVRLFVTQFVKRYNAKDYPANGPVLLTNVYKMYQSWLNDTGRTSDVVELKAEVMSLSPTWSDAVKYFQESAVQEIIQRETENTVGVHIWNSANKHMKVKSDYNCAYLYYVRKSSPIVYAQIVKDGIV